MDDPRYVSHVQVCGGSDCDCCEDTTSWLHRTSRTCPRGRFATARSISAFVTGRPALGPATRRQAPNPSAAPAISTISIRTPATYSAGHRAVSSRARPDRSSRHRWRDRHMGHVYRHIVMSPDGFIAAPGDNLSWVFELVDADAAIEAGRLDE